jgi:Arc/MetJ-type ribon-helix-helix transcriptional regulator
VDAFREAYKASGFIGFKPSLIDYGFSLIEVSSLRARDWRNWENLYYYAYVLHVVTKIVPVRLREEELRRIDRLVEYGIFQSRSEVIRELIRLGVENLAYLSEVLEAVERLFELERVEVGYQ